MPANVLQIWDPDNSGMLRSYFAEIDKVVKGDAK